MLSAMRSVALSLLALSCALALGCGGAREKPDNAAWETRQGFRQLGVDDNGEVDISSRSVGYSGFDWVGVRHDLQLAPDRETKEACSCLAVSVGDPSDSQFVWRGPRPDLNPSNLAVAISAFGVECPGGAANKADRRPSIRAVDRVGRDIVVEIEELPPDRPVATGAIFKPLEMGGHIYVRPRTKNLPYAKVTGKELCRVK